MSTKAGTLQRGPVFGPREWAVMTLVAALAVAALVMSYVALRSTPSTTTTAPRVAGTATADTGIYERSRPVTGTGPDLAVVGNQSILEGIYQRSAPVTGTGPDLVQLANGSIEAGIYQRSAPVTGTGPDLVQVADRSIQEDIYRNSGPVTGTGPGLQHLGSK
jgi:hypothetical protein